MIADSRRKQRAIVCSLLLGLFGLSVCVSLRSHQIWPHTRWEHDRLHSTVEALGAVAAIGMALVLLDRREKRRARTSLVAGLLGMGLLDLFHAACKDLHGLVLLHVSSCLVGATGFAFSWFPPGPRPRRFWYLFAVAVGSFIFGGCVLFLAPLLPAMFDLSGEFAVVAKLVSLAAGTLFVLGSVKFMKEFIECGDRESLLFFGLALLFASADVAFATSKIWDEEWWSWHLTRFTAFVLAFGFVVQGYLWNAARVRRSLIRQKKVERALRKRTRELDDRVKEVDCLYRTHKLMEQPDVELEEMFKEVLRVLFSALRFPQEACGRIVCETAEFKSPDFKQTRWSLACPLTCCQQPIGVVEVCYLWEKARIRGATFTDEERRLLDLVSKELSETIKRRRLESEVSQISSWERQRFGQELHDELGQELTGLGYLAQCLRHDVAGCASATEEAASKLANGLQAAIGKIRLIAKGQALADIDATDFVPSVQAVAALAEERWGVPCRVFASPHLQLDDEDTASQLLRIAQEAIYNAAKHARASQISVHVRKCDGRLMIRVRDDGVGIAHEHSGRCGMGIHIMHHRADAICATLEIGAAKTGGTVVTSTVRLLNGYRSPRQMSPCSGR